MVCKLFACKVCQGEWQSYSHFVTKSLILMKTIKKREKPIIASETELMNCRREKQSVFNFSTSSTNKRNGTKDLNRNCKEN